ncbi:hypothetical protein [Metasolibacillus sp. FSL K6-0083]|uniref:hypothetical protein n=1 Tax=Metasolibacillus sp. FSL K6-0083 TaxID=2921416 RepID=UPI00315A7436
MERKKIFIDQTIGKKKLDTSKMDEWTPEDWKEYFPDESEYTGIQVDLIQHKDFYLKVTLIYIHETEKNTYIEFEAQNKLPNDILIQFGKWRMDNQGFDLSKRTPILIPTRLESIAFSEHVHFMFMESGFAMEVDILDATSLEVLEAYDIEVKVYHS